MRRTTIVAVSLFFVVATIATSVGRARADGNLKAVNHIIIMMQENHSFDNYFGVLPYVSGGPYHPGPCRSNDHSCVDGLTCFRFQHGNLFCLNFNFDQNFRPIFAFHDDNYCPGPDLQHDWQGSHMEANFFDPDAAVFFSPNDGFVVVNAETEQVSGTPDFGHNDTMGYYNQADLPFYYGLAQTFAVSDRHFCSVVGPTLPNRSYELAATSFGHVTTNEIFPPGIDPANPSPLNTSIGYQPVTGTIFDLLDKAGVTWTNYYEDLPTSVIFRGNHIPFLAAHTRTVFTPNPFGGNNFLQDAANGTLPQVSIVDPSFAQDEKINGVTFETDEHPPFDIRAGEYIVSQIINAVRNSPNWKDTVILLTYDEHGGDYDHVPPPRAPQGGAKNPDGIDPGLCEDLSNPPASLLPGGGAQCEFSESDVAAICSTFTDETAPYPSFCANFNQLGFRVPFVAISPFAKPHYVSHTVTDHTSMLALIEQRFLGGAHLTLRDANANPGLDMFDFTNSPSLNATVGTAPAPVVPEHDCPFVNPPPSDGP